jgi:DNA invertase Pin-like site-specific DNA recombinase
MSFTLDESLTLRDLGVSAFNGKNLTPESALGGFLEAVKSGRVPRGSYLAIERLDRLSRANIDTALSVFTGILRAGIKIVTVANGNVYDSTSLNKVTDLIIVLLEFATANQESEKKSHRLKEKWEQRRQRMHEEKMTAWCPAWLELNEDRRTFRLIRPFAATIRSIFHDFVNGTGIAEITRKLNKNRVPLVVRETKRNRGKTGQKWKMANVRKLLTNKALIGHFQPGRKVNGKRIPFGPVETTYYDPVISEELFFKAQARIASVPSRRGQVSHNHANLFTGVLRCPYCGSRMDIRFSYPNGKIHRNIICTNAETGDCLSMGWKLDEFEEAFVRFALEVKTKIRDNNTLSSLQEGISTAESTLADRKHQLLRYAEVVESGRKIPEILLTRMNALEEQIAKDEDDLKRRKTALLVAKNKTRLDTLDILKTNIDLNDPETRLRLSNVIRTTFNRIDVFFAGDAEHFKQVFNAAKRLQEKGTNRMGAVAVRFRREWNIDANRFFIAHLSVPGIEGRLTYPRIDFVDGEVKKGQQLLELLDTHNSTRKSQNYVRSVIPNKERLLEDLRNGMKLEVACRKYAISIPTAALFRQFHKI